MVENSEQYKYYAFISYKSEDVKWAEWLQKRLERYSLPVALQKGGEFPKKLSPVFRDGTDILPKELKVELNEKLEQSRYLIVLCSPKAVSSGWVGDEIDHFCRLGRRDRIISVIIDGIPYSNDPATECYHPKLKAWFPKADNAENDHQLLGADIHSLGSKRSRIKRERAFIQVVATILGLPYDSLWQRRRRQLVADLFFVIALTTAVICTITGVWIAGKPFDANLRLRELTPHNGELPCKNGYVTLVCDNDTLGAKPVENICDVITFSDIPGQFKGKKAYIDFEMYGFQPVDTIVNLGVSQLLSIRRDSTFATYAGTVTYENGESADGVEVMIEDRHAVTDSNGYFRLIFPVLQQTILKIVTLSKEGYKTEQLELQPQPDHKLVLFRP